MDDYSQFYIPQKLDEPERIIIWTIDEFGIGVTPFVLGIIYGYMVTGLGLGVIFLMFWRRLKGQNKDFTIGVIYWYLPIKNLMGLKGTPASHIRFIIG